MIRRVAILCPGPSLSHFDGSDGYDLVVGINRAAIAFRCDVWCAADYQLIERERRNIIGTPVLFTNFASATRLRKRSPWPATVDEFEWYLGGDGLALPGTSFSAIAAVWYAMAKGARIVNVFGASLAGKLDFDGTAAGETRTDARWERERELWETASRVLRLRGAILDRVNA